MDDIEQRKAWFLEYCSNLEKKGIIKSSSEGAPFTCPCCGFPSLSERGGYEICSICFWEDDGQDDPNADEIWGGPNRDYSLTEARSNFKQHLTMYRSGDEPHFSRETTVKKLHIKKQIIKLFRNASKNDDPKLMKDFKIMLNKL